MPVTIHQAIEIKGSAAQIWRYVGTEAGLRRWWGVDIQMDEKQGGRCEERSFLHGRAQHLRGEVTVYEPPHRLVLVLRAPEHATMWPAFSTISLTLRETDGHTLVEINHQAFGTLPLEDVHPSTTGKEQPWEPVRPAILNQLPMPSATLKNSGPQFEPIGLIPPQLIQSVDTVWRAQQEWRWATSLASLKAANEK